MEESFYRDQALASEARALPAAIYNLAHTLLAQCGRDCLFVPIRSMQYLAVIDHEEIIFVESATRPLIELAWQQFNPHARNAIDEAVPYQAVYYTPQATETMKRLQWEFFKALELLAERRVFSGPAKVLKLTRSST